MIDAIADDELKRLQLVTELSPEERAVLAPHLEAVSVAAGGVVFEEGEAGEGALFVRSGALALTSSRSAERVDVGPGTALGALALVSAGPREVCATATQATQLFVLRRSAFRRLRDDEPRAACRLLEAILCESTRLGRAALAESVDEEGDITAPLHDPLDDENEITAPLGAPVDPPADGD